MIHVHVYEVTGKYEADFDTDDIQEAKAAALHSKDRMEFAASDRRYVAIAFKEVT